METKNRPVYINFLDEVQEREGSGDDGDVQEVSSSSLKTNF